MAFVDDLKWYVALVVLAGMIVALFIIAAMPGCTYFERGSVVLDQGTADVHLGRSFGLNVDTRTHVGLGFDDAHSDVHLYGTGGAEFAGTNGAPSE